MGSSRLFCQATQMFRHHRFNNKMEDGMPNARITILKRPDIDHVMNDMAPKCNTPEVAVIEGTAREPERELASPRPSGVLRELALARWRGSATQVSRPPQRGDDEIGTTSE